MTHDEIDAMPAGRKIDALIAEKAMGKKITKATIPETEGHLYVEAPAKLEPGACWLAIPEYSTDIAAAHEVLNHLSMSTVYIWWNDAGSMWQVFLDPKRRLMEDCRFSACDDSDLKDEPNLALAICRAGLKAVLK